ncbi:hypothetical protein Scep_003334 [Stephania cephalantha]|uniref:Uncharacterized protein n=1 Tax=Stephania cephalantha TaxID=152367 RepID=A0AAP0PVP9_9MAGN
MNIAVVSLQAKLRFDPSGPGGVCLTAMRRKYEMRHQTRTSSAYVVRCALNYT